MVINKDVAGASHFIKYIKRRISRNQNFLGAITGPTGSGKSYSALSIAADIDPNFCIENVAFTPDDLFTIINSGRLVPGSVILYDEAGVGMGAREWQSLGNKVLSFLLQTFRNLNLVVLFNLPHLGMFDAQGRKLIHAHLSTKRIIYSKSLCVIEPLLTFVDQATGDISYRYLRVTTGGVARSLSRIKILKPSDNLALAYEAKKTLYTEDLNRRLQAQIQEKEAKKEKKVALVSEKSDIEAFFRMGGTVREALDRGMTSYGERHLQRIRKKTTDEQSSYNTQDSTKKNYESRVYEELIGLADIG